MVTRLNPDPPGFDCGLAITRVNTRDRYGVARKRADANETALFIRDIVLARGSRCIGRIVICASARSPPFFFFTANFCVCRQTACFIETDSPKRERNTPCVVIDCAFAMHGCMMTFTGRDEGPRAFLLPFFFAMRIRNTPRNGSRLTTWTERGRQEGRPPAKKYLDSAYKLALVAHDYACIRRIPSTPGSRLQSSKDGLLYLCTNVDS